MILTRKYCYQNNSHFASLQALISSPERSLLEPYWGILAVFEEYDTFFFNVFFYF